MNELKVMNTFRTARVVEPVEVTLMGAEGRTHAEVRDFAVKAAGEEGRNFGTKVTIVGNFATVTIYRD